MNFGDTLSDSSLAESSDHDNVELVTEDEVDIEDDGIDIGSSLGISNFETQDEEQYHYEVLTLESVSNYMKGIVHQVTSIIELPDPVTRLLLNHFKWDREKLMETFYDSQDQEELFAKAGILKPDTVSPIVYEQKPGTASSIVRLSRKTNRYECEICLGTFPSDGMFALGCGHAFCRGCWRSYLTSKIMDEDDEMVLNILLDPQVKRRYQYLTLKTFVEMQQSDAKPVKCHCGFSFCFQCGSDWHAPVMCSMLQRWVRKCTEDSETSNWIAANTKECPNCHVVIHKDGGCNHMTCRNASCKTEFCWVCLGPWEPHGSSWYSCNRYNDDTAVAARTAQERSRTELQRYVHYYNRYSNHMLSLQLENKLYAAVKTKMEEIQSNNMSWVEVQFLRKAVDVLCECRRTLKYTYVFAYYLERNNQSIIFENNQNDLELSTEELSGFLERDMAGINLITLKQRVQDKYRYCEQRRKALLSHCHEGDENGWWSFRE
uniref:RBR-type E3 ubiquitin transferase n=1 Tax=Trichuris muris TaxID=70415 RepID=A0A5S6QTM3_TRIMR